MPLVSIVTPCYNSRKYLDDTWKSIHGQTFQDWEWLVIDDLSSDGSFEWLEGVAATDSRVKAYRLELNSGPAGARNFGIDRAAGRYLTFLDSDDLWNPDFLEKSLAVLATGEAFVFASYRRRLDGTDTYISDFVVPERVTYRDILKSCPISCLTAVMDLSLIGKHHMHEGWREDYSLWLQVLKLTPSARGIREPLATYRLRQGSVSHNKVRVAIQQWNMYFRYERLGFFKSVYYFVHYAFIGFMKYRS